MVIVFLRFGNLFFRGLDIYLLVEESFHAVLKYLFSVFLNFASSSIIILFFSSSWDASSPFSIRYDSNNCSTLSVISEDVLEAM